MADIINGFAAVDRKDACEESFGKPYLQIIFEDGRVVRMTTNLAELIGGMGEGTRLWWEDQQKR